MWLMAAMEQPADWLSLTGVAAIIAASASIATAIIVPTLGYRFNKRLAEFARRETELASAMHRNQATIESSQTALRRIIKQGRRAYEELYELANFAKSCTEDDRFVLKAGKALALLSPFINNLREACDNGELANLEDLEVRDASGGLLRRPNIDKLMLHVSQLFLLQSTEWKRRSDQSRISLIDRHLESLDDYLDRMTNYANRLGHQSVRAPS